MRLSRYGKAIIGMAITALFLLPAAAGPAKEAKSEKSPLFTLKTLKGENWSLEKNFGKGPIVVNFWATWCGPCILEMKNMKKVFDSLSPKGVQFIAISIDDNKTQPQIPGTLRKYNIPYTVLLDGNKEVFKAFQGTNPPNLFIIDSKGMLVYKHSGYQKGDEKTVEKILKGLVEGEK